MKDICAWTDNVYKNNANGLIQYALEKPYEEKDKIIMYLKNSNVIAYAAGIAKDVFSGKSIQGSLAYMSDGIFEWRSDIIYYADKYNLKLDDSFIEYVLNKIHEQFYNKSTS